MNTYLLEHLVSMRLTEARAQTAHATLVKSLAPVRQPLRVTAGVGLIKIGRWLAHTAPRRAAPRRATA